MNQCATLTRRHARSQQQIHAPEGGLQVTYGNHSFSYGACFCVLILAGSTQTANSSPLSAPGHSRFKVLPLKDWSCSCLHMVLCPHSYGTSVLSQALGYAVVAVVASAACMPASGVWKPQPSRLVSSQNTQVRSSLQVWSLVTIW